MRNIARRLIAEEHDPTEPNDARAAFRVCNKLGKSLSVLTGSKGFGSLLRRALGRAGHEVPWLNELLVAPNGLLALPTAGVEARLPGREATRGALVLVTYLLELLATFIGESLTLRLVQQVWPKVALKRETS